MQNVVHKESKKLQRPTIAITIPVMYTATFVSRKKTKHH